MKKDINKDQEHRVILNNFLSAVSKYANKAIVTYLNKRKFIRACFKQTFKDKNNYKNIKLYLRAMRCEYNYSEYNVYDVLHMTPTQPDSDSILTVKKHFYNNMINLHLNDSYYYKMQKFIENFDSYATKINAPLLKKQRKYKHYVGIAIILATLIITILIPNHAINMTGLTVGNFLFVIFHFLVLQFSNLINVASIGRLMINAIVDIPVIKHYFLD